ncbi:serine/threonine-protein kinase [Mycobacterium paragordonae]|uniref:serine/threonine-protein kinase n=1 Tax=Mycobacterium paragordonae TaxID=1389713 RepID=UPI0018CC1141|nr:serine/threonine-protein kinase [Mycobacterium paragordonae]
MEYRETLTQPLGVLSGRYELGKVLGRGGMSEVREGWDLKLSRPVAIKLLQSGPGDEEGPDTRLRFETEARATAALSSSNIVIVHDVGEHQGLPFIVMERLPGVSLADHIARGPLPQPFVQTVLNSVLAALASAHDAGILHRDVKPGNILFTAAGEAKLADFGIAKTAGGARTMTGHVVGTMAYLSPDRLAGKPATPADDLYAVGVVGYEALTGRRPFPQQAFPALANAILHETPPPIAALRPDVRPELAAVFERAMTRNPAARFYKAGAMREALNAPASRPAPVPVPAPVPNRTRVMPTPPAGPSTYIPVESEPTRVSRKLWAAAIVAVLLLVIMLMALGAPFSAPPPTPAGTTTPLPPPTTETSTIASTSELAPAPPQAPGPPGKPGKKPKGPKGD